MSSDAPLADDPEEGEDGEGTGRSAAGDGSPPPGEGDPDEGPVGDLPETERLAGELARLEAENDRLRAAYAHSKRTEYRQTAVALVAVGALAALGAVLFAGARTVLFALAGTGVFLGVLTYFLAPEQFLPASVGREVYDAMADNQARIVAELGLSEDRIYLPVDDGVRLYVPRTADASLPDDAALEETFVVFDGGRGVALCPTGEALFAEFERSLEGGLATTREEVGPQLTEALVEQFELLASVEQSSAGTDDAGRLTVGVVDSAYGPPDRFDNPVVSFLGVGVARALDAPVGVTVDLDGNERVDAVVTCRWPYESGEGIPDDPAASTDAGGAPADDAAGSAEADNAAESAPEGKATDDA